VDKGAQAMQWKSSLGKFTRLLWSMDWEASLRTLSAHTASLNMFAAWVEKEDPLAVMKLQAFHVANELQDQPAEARGLLAIQLCQRHFGEAKGSAEEAADAIVAKTNEALSFFAADLFPKFVQSKACLPVVDNLLSPADLDMRSSADLLWSEYLVPGDVSGWLHSFVTVAETYPACLVISDMSLPGNPMCFVNKEFCRVTGYAKHEAQGRNCRFLQGPKTEPQSVAVIQGTLRRGVDCHVRITNYRKSGDLFENLLTLRPVHDSNGVYRFCIGIQFEIARADISLRSRLAKLDKLIRLLPSSIDVSGRAVGAQFTVQQAPEEISTDLATKLERALEGNTVGPKPKHTAKDAAYFADNHQTMLKELERRPAALVRRPSQVTLSGATPPVSPVVTATPPSGSKSAKSSFAGMKALVRLRSAKR